ncbi:hypothetical protein [Variovorax guangxiensis]|nr:hypothetical protein [Variovorax guangxiensis]MDR6861354.1 hypothetical protein [Variovorax guangxiensis]
MSVRSARHPIGVTMALVPHAVACSKQFRLALCRFAPLDLDPLQVESG